MTGQELIDWIRENQAEGLMFYKLETDMDGEVYQADIDPEIERGEIVIV